MKLAPPSTAAYEGQDRFERSFRYVLQLERNSHFQWLTIAASTIKNGCRPAGSPLPWFPSSFFLAEWRLQLGRCYRGYAGHRLTKSSKFGSSTDLLLVTPFIPRSRKVIPGSSLAPPDGWKAPRNVELPLHSNSVITGLTQQAVTSTATALLSWSI